MTDEPDILLASASPRRRELLDLLGVRYRAWSADIDESRLADEAPDAYVERLARAKAAAGRQAHGNERPVLGADTIVLLDGDILGKPRDRAHARDMFSRLAGRHHEVLTAVAVVATDGRVFGAINRTRVEFGEVPAHWVDHYATLDEPMDKAGAYAVQGLAGQWIQRVEGSYTGVMGLPLFETAELLRQAGLALTGR
ncbi:septum formation inhibitor Maf [Marinihelvus fidelis]|uniref:dTTP/UTP pyrophosphatase n=1 Tax=Marinihelvus fidelis TaxID=2613842 RepID=A0A5N0T6Y9_9GAMM|nr:Maf family protein [Marinihelvus fidelis]KAA9130244.1 septum formation inhibitor Maf [Marinihelvus fidelis]